MDRLIAGLLGHSQPTGVDCAYRTWLS